MPRGGSQARSSINGVATTTLAPLLPPYLLVSASLLTSSFRGRWRAAPGIQPQSITLAVDDRQEEGQHDEVTDEHLQRRFGQTTSAGGKRSLQKPAKTNTPPRNT